MDLNFAHIHGARPDALQQRDTAAGRPFVVSRDESCQIRAVFHHHLAVGAEAAGCHDHAFGCHSNGFVLFGSQTHAGHFAVFEDNVADGGIQHHLDVALVDVTHQAADQIPPHRRTVFRTVRTVNAHPTGGGDVVQHNAARCQPLNCFRRILDKATQQFRVVLVAAAFQAFLIEQLFAVLNALHALEAGFCGVHTGRSFNRIPANGWHFLDDQHARTFVVGLNRRRQTGAAAADHHYVHAFGLVRISALFRCQRLAGFQHRFRDGFLHRFTLAGCAGDGIHVRGIGIQNTGADLFEAGDKLDVFARAGGQLNVGNAVGFEADVNHQFVHVVLHFLNEGAGFEFGFAHAHVADHRFHQREAPQRLRDAQFFAFGAVHKQLQVFTGLNAVCPVRVGNSGAANGNQVVTVFQRFIHV